MKKLLIFFAMMMPMVSSAQVSENKQLTKFEQLISKTGHLSKFVDVTMPTISGKFMEVNTCIRTVIGEQSNTYFYRIKETKNSITHIAMIEYSDLVEINKALVKLVNDVEADCAVNPDYLENRFVTNDGFQIGYYVSNGKATWYLKLERYSNSTIFIKNAETLTTNFAAAQTKIEILKASYGK